MQLPFVKAFNDLNSFECTETVSMKCNECIYVKEVVCHKKQQQNRSGIKERCINILSKSCNICKVNDVLTECHKTYVNCNKKVTVELDCVHEVKWHCGAENDPRNNPTICRACIYMVWDNLIQAYDSRYVKSERLENMVNQQVSELKDFLISNELKLSSVSEKSNI